MRLFIAVVVSILLCPSVSNAAECSFSENKTDPFSKDSFVKTKWQLLADWNDSSRNQGKGVDFSIDVQAETDGDRDFLVLKMKLKDGSLYAPNSTNMRNAVTVRQGDLLKITLMDKSVVELPAEKTVWAPTRAKSEGNHYIYRASFDVRYLLDSDAAAALIRQNTRVIHMIATQSGHEFFDDRAPLEFDVKDKNQREIKRAVRCLSQIT